MPNETSSGPRARKLLTEVECRNAEPRAKRWRRSYGNHLFLLVMPNGKKYWQVRYHFDGRDRLFSIGRYVENADGPRAFGLRAAREARNEIMAAVEAGHDPNEIKRAILEGEPEQDQPGTTAAPDAGERSVRALALKWMAHRDGAISDNYAVNIRRRFELDVFPVIGGMDVAHVTQSIILNDVLRRIEARGSIESARRMRQHLEKVFTYARVEGFLPKDHQNPASDDMVVSLKTPKKGKRRPARTELNSVRDILRRCEASASHPTVRLACRLQHLVVLRSSELLNARWEQFEGLDGPEPIWTVPAEQMKMERPFVVPLSRQGAEQHEAPELIGDGGMRLATRHQLEAEGLLQHGLRLWHPALALLEFLCLLRRGHQQGEDDLAGGFRLQAGPQGRPGQAAADIVDQGEGRRRVPGKELADLGGVVGLRLEAEAFVAITVAVREDGAAGGIDREGVRLPILIAHGRLNDKLHDREVRLDNGWTVKIGRGLDFYQKPEGWFTVGATDLSLRRCLETKVDVFRTPSADK